MRYILALTCVLSIGIAFGQTRHVSRSPISVVSRIFNEYKTNEEGIETVENKEAMTRAIKAIKKVSRTKDLLTLIDVWMYYDPTDYPTRSLIEPIFLKNKSATLKALNYRSNHLRKWEDMTTAPWSDLILLEKKLKQ